MSDRATPSSDQNIPASTNKCEAQFRALVENASVPLWQQDYTLLLVELDILHTNGVVNIREYVATASHELHRLATLIRSRYANLATRRLLSDAPEDTLQNCLEKLLTGSLAKNTFIDLLDALCKGKARFEGELECTCPRGNHLHVIMSLPLPPAGTAADNVPVSLQDITLRKQTELALAASENRYRVLFEKSKDAILIIEDGIFVDCNEATREMLGYASREALLQTHPSELSPPFQPDGQSSIEKADLMINLALKNGSHRFEWDHQRCNGEVFPVEVLLTAFEGRNGKQIIHTVWRDISVEKQQRERIHHQANFDALTGLPNRFQATDRLAILLEKAKRHHEIIAVFFIDLDDFKKVNDTLGHEIGDKLLIEIAGRLSENLRQGDTFARLGGDEFIVLLDNIHRPVDAHKVAEHLLECFRRSFLLDGHELVISASVGVACYPFDGDNVNELLRNADTAMYHSKRNGRNMVHAFTPAMNQEVSRRLQIEERLHGALERSELEVYYQPVIDATNLQVIGAEALLRWLHPLLGEIAPEEFIPVAEQTGQIVPLGRFVMQCALEATKIWQGAYRKDFIIAINFSPCQFRDTELMPTLESLLRQTGINARHVALELTESVLLSAHNYIHEALDHLNDMGIEITMDDFGTGFSSLSQLRRYPFQALKIDRSFVRDIDLDKANAAVVTATIAMAHGLGLKVVAEGVETQAQAEFLIAHQCDRLQGFFFAEPMPQARFSQFLKKNA